MLYNDHIPCVLWYLITQMDVKAQGKTSDFIAFFGKPIDEDAVAPDQGDCAWRQGADTRAGPTRKQRMVGVVYHPENEEKSHYVQCKMCNQFDCMVYVDVTTSLVTL